MVLGLASTTPLLLLTGLIAGIRHGIDWDHLAAISDITSTQNKIGKGIFMSFLYGLGHACVVAAIALGLLLLSFALPQGVDRIMESGRRHANYPWDLCFLFTAQAKGSGFQDSSQMGTDG